MKESSSFIYLKMIRRTRNLHHHHHHHHHHHPWLRSHSTPATIKWLQSNYEAVEGICILRSELYVAYLEFSRDNYMQPVNAASFGKILRKEFPSLMTRRLGTRGQSKYHYYGLGQRKVKNDTTTTREESSQEFNSTTTTITTERLNFLELSADEFCWNNTINNTHEYMGDVRNCEKFSGRNEEDERKDVGNYSMDLYPQTFISEEEEHNNRFLNSIHCLGKNTSPSPMVMRSAAGVQMESEAQSSSFPNIITGMEKDSFNNNNYNNDNICNLQEFSKSYTSFFL